MLLKESSVLRRLPAAIEEKQLLILDSLRFTIDIIEYNYENIESRAIRVSEGKEKKKFPQLFHYVWSLLDNIRRFIMLYQVLATDNNYALIEPIKYVNDSRNTYQHMEARIDESLIDNRQPFFGKLKWTYHDKTSSEAYRFVAMSGILYGDPGKVEFMKFNENLIIENIYLETVDKKQKTEINISQLYLDFKGVVNDLEKGLERKISELNLELSDWASRQDIIIKFKNELSVKKK
ncbi:hypothetical protein [Arenibacter sp. S6351L]|uniref:hypothetical protein n=1 Tax=Arenibacter sp. S6351L TaxID=2926407 RepID=UPI001FF17F20|nr:hypothetical protein [Arenibacter sp. S6351L]MCK0137417.1 hypothetical protein [Arenibacter sp. S6351L]